MEEERTFNLQLFADEGEGQTETSPADFGAMSAAEQSEILGNMVKGEPTKQPIEPPDEIDVEVGEELAKDLKMKSAKRKIKVNGEEIELTDEELIAHAQKGIAADKRFEEASKLRKEAKADRDAIQAEQQAKQIESNKGRLALTKQQSAQFATMFQQTFGEEYNQYDDDHRDIKNQFQMQQMLTNMDQQRNQSVIDQANAWAEANPAEIDKLDDAIYALGTEPTARKQMRALLVARGRFDENKATVNDLQMLEEFRVKAIVTKPLPKEVVEEKKKAQKAEKAGGEPAQKAEKGIDWDRFSTDNAYQTEVLGRRKQ